MKKVEVSKEENLIIPAYANSLFIVDVIEEYNRNKWKNFEYLKNSDTIKPILDITSLGNIGMISMLLYSFLVLPRGLFEDKYKDGFDNVNKWIKGNHEKCPQKYKKDINDESNNKVIDYLRHIRNGVSHALLSFNDSKCVVINDEYPKNGDKFEIWFNLEQIAGLMNQLIKEVILPVIRDFNQKQSQ